MPEETRRRRRTAEIPTSLEQQIIDSAKAEPEEVENAVGPDPSKITMDRLIPSGVTLLNCGCSDCPFGAFALGSINTIPGKSASGKTELMLTMLASCAIDKRFDGYDLFLDDAEHAMAFNLEYLFPPLVGRIKAPKYDKDGPVYSETIQDFEHNMLLKFDKPKKSDQKTEKSIEEETKKEKTKKRPFIYVLDSLDSLTSTEELEREWKNALKLAKSPEAVKELNKSYGTEKSRIIGSVLRMINGLLKNSDSALFIVQQTRQNINKEYGEPEWITAGGEAPFFYSFHRIFLSGGKSLTAESMNIKHQIGGHTRCEVVKNKLNGKRRKSGIEFDIYEDLGIDDVSSCVDFLKTTETWWNEGAYMFAPEILGNGEKMYRSDLIRYIENENAIPELQKLVGQVWNDIENEIRLKDRKRRF